jgi:hypothetical protein
VYLLRFLLVLSIFLLAGFYFLNYESADHTARVADSPCEQPLTYSIDHIDSRFGLSEDEVHQAMRDAVSLWSDAADAPLAMHEEQGGIVVRFTYDERQERVDSELRFREEIHSEQTRMNQLQRDYDINREQFDERSEEYTTFAEKTTERLNALNDWISERNNRDGFTEKDLEQYEQEKAEVEQMQQHVFREREELDELARRINRDTERLNEKINATNHLIDQYNEEFSGENRFTKATFQRTGRQEGVINVNTFLNRQELVLILAHELGHAFGMGHVDNPRSVMYHQMGAQEFFPVLQLSAEDREALQAICR